MAWVGARIVASVPLLVALGAGGCDTKDDGSDDGMAGSPDDESDTDDGEPDDPADEPGGGSSPGGGSGPTPEPKPSPAEACDPEVWDGYACTTEDGVEGKNFCILVDGEELFTPCETTPPECQPGDNLDMGCLGSICYWDGEALRYYSWSEPDCITPLVMSFDGAPIEFAPASAAAFDLSPDGTCTSTDWPTAPWLALDRDGDGMIRDGSELFGSATKMSAGGVAEHGFAALAELDSNRDGKISAADDRFAELVLWSDLDDDRVGAHGELRPLAEAALVSIDLSFGRRAVCDQHGNCGYERAAFEYRTPQGTTRFGEVVDVHLPCR